MHHPAEGQPIVVTLMLGVKAVPVVSVRVIEASGCPEVEVRIPATRTVSSSRILTPERGGYVGGMGTSSVPRRRAKWHSSVAYGRWNTWCGQKR